MIDLTELSYDTLLFFVAEAARCNNVTDSKIEFAMKLWVKYAHDRDGGRRTRQLKKSINRINFQNSINLGFN